MALTLNKISFIMCFLFGCLILQEIEAQLDFYSSQRRISSVFPRASSFRPRSIAPFRSRSRPIYPLRSRSAYPNRSRLRQRPVSREVSVPSVRRSPVPGQAFVRRRAQQALNSRSLSRISTIQREITPVRRTRFTQELPPVQQRIQTPPRSLQVGQVAPGAYPIRYSGIAYRNNNNDNSLNDDRNFPERGLVNAGTAPRVTNNIGRSLIVQTRQPVRTSNLLPLPLSPIQRQSQTLPQNDFPKVLSKQRIQSFTAPSKEAQSRSLVFPKHQNKILEPVQVLRPLESSSMLQSISQPTGNTKPVLVKTAPSHTAHINIGAGDGDSSTIVLQARMSGNTNPVVKTLVQPSQNRVLPSSNVATISASDVDNSQIQIQGHVNDVQPKSPLAADPFHQDLVDAFTKVIESVLVQQGNVASSASQPGHIVNNNMNNALLPLVPPTVPTQQDHIAFQANMAPAYAGMNQYSPSHIPGVMMGSHFNPYSHFGHMASFGYMNPWMSPAMMQEMMFGDTTDPPDGMTTTAAPVNVSSANITENTTIIPATINDVLVDTAITMPVVTEITKLKIETNTNDKIPPEPVQATNVEVGATTEVKIPIKETETPVKVVLKPTDANLLTKNVDQSVTVVEVRPDSKVTVKSKSSSDKLGSLLVKEALKNALKNITVVEIKPEINKLQEDTVKVEVKQSIVKTEESTNVMSNNDGKEPIKVEVRHHLSDSGLDTTGKIDAGPENTPKSLDLNVKIKSPKDAVKITQQSALLKKKKEKNTDKTNKTFSKVVDKNEKLIIDIVALIRKSKVDLKHLSNMISGESYPKVDITPAEEPVPTAEQLGIKLKGPYNGNSTGAKVNPTPPNVEYTHMPIHVPTIPPVPEVSIAGKSTLPPVIPKGLIFTRQPEIYRTLRTILKHNPGALKEVLPPDPTPTYNTAQATQPYLIGTSKDSLDDKSSLHNHDSVMIEVSTPTPNNTATAKPDIPVMLNAIDQNVKMQEISKDDAPADSNGSSVRVDSALHQQLKDLNVTDVMSNDDNAIDIAKYLADPTFVEILRGMLQSMAGKQEMSTHGYYNAPETTTFLPDVSTTSYPISTTEEYELEDYITEAP